MPKALPCGGQAVQECEAERNDVCLSLQACGAGPSCSLPSGCEDWLLPSYQGLFVFSLLSSPFSKNVGFFILPSLSFFLKCSAFCSRPEAAGVPPQDRDFTHGDSCVPEQSGLPTLRHITRGAWEGLLEALVTTGHQCKRRS